MKFCVTLFIDPYDRLADAVEGETQDEDLQRAVHDWAMNKLQDGVKLEFDYEAGTVKMVEPAS